MFIRVTQIIGDRKETILLNKRKIVEVHTPENYPLKCTIILEGGSYAESILVNEPFESVAGKLGL